MVIESQPAGGRRPGSLLVPFALVLAACGTDADESAELGPLIRRTSDIARQLTPAEQVYNCLWSHHGGEPVHIHYLVQRSYLWVEYRHIHCTFRPIVAVLWSCVLGIIRRHAFISRVKNLLCT